MGASTLMSPELFRGLGKAGGLGMLGGGLFGMFGGGEDPTKEANKYLNQIPGAISPYFNPYINAGQGALGQLQGQYGNLINDPNAMYNKLAGGYQQSPGYQWQLNQGTNAVNNAAAAGGLLGSPQHQQNAAQMTQGIANQDFNNYLSQVMGLYGTGLQGMGGINQMGFNASTGMANALANNLMNQAQLGYAGAVNRNQSQGGAFGNILGGLGSLAAFGGLF